MKLCIYIYIYIIPAVSRGVVNQPGSVLNSNDPSSSIHSSPIQPYTRFLIPFCRPFSPDSDSDSDGDIPPKLEQAGKNMLHTFIYSNISPQKLMDHIYL